MKRRASNGMGSIRQRPDGRWEARYTSPDGVQRSVYARTEAEVTRKLRAVLHDLDSGSWREPSALTVSQWADVWLRDYQQHTTPQTANSYRTVINHHIIPVIGSVRLSKLSTIHARRVISAMIEAGKSPTYTSKCRNILSGMLSAAVEAGILKSNPVESVKAPRITHKEPHIIDREIIPAFVQAAERHKYGLPAVFALFTGLRAGELRGLFWSDLSGSALTVQRQILETGAFAPPKDGSSRTIELTPEALSILRRQKINLAALQLQAGSGWNDSDLIFRKPNGQHIDPSTFRDAVRAIGQSIGIQGLHPHDLRHSYAVAALRSGADVKSVQHNLGHKSAAMTLDIYAAYTKDAGRVSAERLSEYLKNALNPAD